MSTCIMASASAVSVPGRGCTNQSALSAVMVRTGSTTTTVAPADARLLDEGPQVAVRHAGVGAPQDDEAAVHQVHRVHAATIAVGRGRARTGGGTAQRARLHRGPEPVEEAPRQAVARDQALVAGARPWQHRLTAVSLDRGVSRGRRSARGRHPSWPARSVPRPSGRSARADAARGRGCRRGR